MNSEKKMKTYLTTKNQLKNLTYLLPTILIVILSACSPEAEEKTTLTIINNSGNTIYSFKWNGIEWDERVFGSGKKYINSGDKQTIDVEAGSGYVFFTVFNRNGVGTKSSRTQEYLEIKSGEKKSFAFLDSTIVIGDNNSPCTLLEFAP